MLGVKEKIEILLKALVIMRLAASFNPIMTHIFDQTDNKHKLKNDRCSPLREIVVKETRWCRLYYEHYKFSRQ